MEHHSGEEPRKPKGEEKTKIKMSDASNRKFNSSAASIFRIQKNKQKI